MPFKKGQPKVPGSGRQRGTLNRRSLYTHEIVSRLGIDPLLAIAEIANDYSHDVGIRLSAAKELAQYVHPKRRALNDQEVADQHAKEFHALSEDEQKDHLLRMLVDTLSERRQLNGMMTDNEADLLKEMESFLKAE